ncbi:MAG: TrkH family potassium uptake protein [Candidatus Nanohaloarchaea archaeon]
MRSPVILRFVGRFLQIFSLMLVLPLFVAVYYSGNLYVMSGFFVSSVAAAVLGTAVYVSGDDGDPTVGEAMFSTVLGWVLAIMFGSIPFLVEMSLVNALFESAAGITTTGISMVLRPGSLPSSLLFWRSFMQWIGGLGILTFFIAVIRESGGVTRRLYSAEAHKTDSGSIRPSLTKSISDLWRVYGFLTVVFTGVYIGLGMSGFNALLHSFSAISTGGFSTVSGSLGAFSQPIQAATVLFMFIGGVNFVLLYRFLQSEFTPLWKSSEFRLYTKIFLLVSGFIALEMLLRGAAANQALLDSLFTSAAFISSTGYATTSAMAFSSALQVILIGVMFVGGSLGSTSGGFKVFRLKAMIELMRTRIRSYRLPESAVNKVKIDGEIVEDSTMKTISTLFFSWVVAISATAVATLMLENVSFIGAFSGAVSAVGNMGPVYIEGAKMAAMSQPTKIVWIIAMLAGRLEMIPLLAIFNSELLKDS